MKAKGNVWFFVLLVSVVFSSASEAKLKLTPSVLDCPDTRVGQSVSCGNINVKNTNLLLSNKVRDIEVGDDENFTIDADGCQWTTLRAKASCNVAVTFHPTVEADFDTNLIVNYSGTIRRHTVSADIYGTAIRPIVSLSTDTAAFGDQTVDTSSWQYVTMKNIGSDTLSIDSITAPLGSGFRVNTDCEDTLAVSETCLIQIFFEPTLEMSYAATIEVNDDADDSPQTIEASGTGIAAGQPDVNLDKTFIDFGNKLVNSTNTDTITVTNTGTVNLTITSIAASGTYFSQTNDCGASLAVDSSCTITVTFNPLAVGAFSGLITLTDNATDSPQTVTLQGTGVSPDAILTPDTIEFGNQTIGKSSSEHQITLLNSGTSDLTITSIDTSSTVFTQTNDCPSTLGAQKTCNIFVTFSPTEAGFVSGTLTVTDDAISGSTQTAFLFGTGITGPDVDIVPGLHDFGNVSVGETSEPQDFKVTNTGDGDLSIYSITANSDFSQTNDCPEVLAEEEACTIEALFTPAVSGNFFGILSISDDATGSPHKANLWGYGTSSDVTLIPASIDFGNQTVGRSSLAQTVLFQNTGTDSITITNIASDSTEFTQTNDCGATLSPSSYCTISITFTPAATGEASGSIIITDSASGSPHNVDLFGTGIDPSYPDIDVSPNYNDFGNIIVGSSSAAKEFTVKNTGIVDVTIYSIDTNSEFTQTNDCPATLTEGVTCTISVTFSPQSSGSFTGHIRIIDNTPDGYQLVALMGTATHSGDIDISISATEVNFGNVSVNTASDPQSIIVTNSGANDLIIGSVALEGSDSIYFSKDTNCQDVTLDAEKSCIINVTFNPTGSGQQKAVVLLYSDAPGSPHDVLVQGNGTGSSGCAMADTCTPNSLAMLLIAGVLCSIRRYKIRKNDR